MTSLELWMMKIGGGVLGYICAFRYNPENYPFGPTSGCRKCQEFSGWRPKPKYSALPSMDGSEVSFFELSTSGHSGNSRLQLVSCVS